MPDPQRNTLRKEERLHGFNATEELFNNTGSRSMVAFPLRLVYVLKDSENPDGTRVRMMVSVPKRHFKRAVKRNRVKRQVREAYRKNKHQLCDTVAKTTGKDLSMAFIWLADSLMDSQKVEQKVVNLLTRVQEKLERHNGRHAE